MTDNNYILDESIELHDASHRVELTYGYQDYPIIIIKHGKESGKIIDTNEDCYGNCEYTESCTLFKSLEWACIDINKVINTLPKRLRFAHVYGAHSGQCSIEEIFKTYDFDDSMIAWGESQRAVLRIRYENKTKIHYIGFDFESITEEDIAGIVYLAKLIQSCSKYKMYLCFKEPLNN